MKKVTLELCAGYMDWKVLLDSLNDVVVENARDISNLEITYSENDE